MQSLLELTLIEIAVLAARGQGYGGALVEEGEGLVDGEGAEHGQGQVGAGTIFRLDIFFLAPSSKVAGSTAATLFEIVEVLVIGARCCVITAKSVLVPWLLADNSKFLIEFGTLHWCQKIIWIAIVLAHLNEFHHFLEDLRCLLLFGSSLLKFILRSILCRRGEDAIDIRG